MEEEQTQLRKLQLEDESRAGMKRSDGGNPPCNNDGGDDDNDNEYNYSTSSDVDHANAADRCPAAADPSRSYHQGSIARSRGRSKRWEMVSEQSELGGGVQLWRPSANLSIETVNALPHKVKRYYQDILGWGEALPGYASAALAMGAHEYERLVSEYHSRDHHRKGVLWQAAYVKAFCNNLRTFLRDYNRWMLQHWPTAVNHLFLHPESQVTFQHLALTLRYMNDFSIPIREALYIFKKIQRTW